jgi:hypothetical protein
MTAIDQTTPTSTTHQIVDVNMETSPGILGTSGTGFPQPMFPRNRNPQTFGHPPFDFTIPVTDQLPQLDRQFVYDSFTGFKPSPTSYLHTEHQPPFSTINGADVADVADVAPPADTTALFTGQMDPNAPSGAGEFYQPSAWFLPFNLDPIGASAGLDPVSQPDSTTPDMGGFATTGNTPLATYEFKMAGMNHGHGEMKE